MEIKKEEIFPGIVLNYVNKSNFKHNYIDIIFIMPLEKENVANNALVFPVINRGTEKYPKMIDIKRQSEDNYDTYITPYVTKRGDNQVFSLSATILKKKYTFDNFDTLATCLDMYDQMINHPYLENGKFSKEYVDSVKEKLIDAEKSKINNKGTYSVNRCLQIMYKDDVFASPVNGEVEDIEKCNEETVYLAYKNILKKASIYIYCVGDFDYEYLKKAISGLFSDIERDKNIYKYSNRKFVVSNNDVEKVYERINVKQGKLVLGFTTDTCESDEDYYKFKVFNNIFGGGTMSKLFMNVREKLSLCYYCSSFEDNTKGHMLVTCGIQMKNEKKTFDEIMHQLKCIQNGEISDDELKCAKEDFISIIRGVEDSCGSIAGWHFSLSLRNKQISPNELIDIYNSVTKEDVIKQANKVKLVTYYFLCGKEKT